MVTRTTEMHLDSDAEPLVHKQAEVRAGIMPRLAWMGLIAWASVATLLAIRPLRGDVSSSTLGRSSVASIQGLAEVTDKPCNGKGALPGALNCGRGTAGVCLVGQYCDIEPSDAWAVCCMDEVVPFTPPPIPPASPPKVAAPSFYRVYHETFQHATYVDLTHAFSPRSPVWPGFGPAKFGAAAAGAKMEGYVDEGDDFTYVDHGFMAGTYNIPTDQYGTQLDPPAHWNELGATISDVPATVAVRPLVVLDVHEQVSKNASYHATVADAKAWEAKHGMPIPAGSVVMIRSDWSKGWENFSKNGLPGAFPGVDIGLLKFLHNDRSILFHGHEPLDTDMTLALVGEAWLMHNNFMQAEGVMNLDKVPEYGCLVSIGFAKPQGGLGGFARYVAICPEGTAPKGVTIQDAPGAPLAKQPHPLRRNADGIMLPDSSAVPTKYCSVGSALGCVNGKAYWEE